MPDLKQFQVIKPAPDYPPRVNRAVMLLHIVLWVAFAVVMVFVLSCLDIFH